MIILDTNVVSETMRRIPSPAIVDWLNAQKTAELYITSVTAAEIRFGLFVLPDGKRRRELTTRFERFIAQGFTVQRVLPFDLAAANYYGEIMGGRSAGGHPMSIPDGQIAAITRALGFSLSTRNTKDFLDCGIELINPFNAR